MHRRFAVAVSILLTLSACQPAPPCPEPAREGDATVIYLARHAEALYPPPEDDPRNPPLNAMGQDRADALARLLADAGIDHVHSTDYARTRETAAPIAELLGIEIELYDPTDLAGFAERLRALPGRHLVLGHSNTTPELVAALRGDPGEPIDESIEFDRLYTVIVGPNADTTTLLQRYGDPTPDNWREMASQRR